MARSTFKVLFYLKRQAEQNGKAPIMGRITINGTISQFSCKLSISPKLWDTKANKATGKSVVARRINEKLENIKTNIGKQYQRICDRDSYVTAEKVKNAWLGFRDGYQLLLQTFDEYLNDFEKNRVGKDRKASTLENYRKQYRRLAAFLQYEYKVEDIPFRELKREFIEKYVVYLSTVRRMLPGTLPNAIKKLKLMSYTAFKNGWIASDPFAGFRVADMSLRHVARHAGLSFNPTMHVRRHTFATTVTLSQGVPLETVSKMLGHKHITTTQIYAKITNDKIGKDMDMLSEKIAGKFRMAR